MEQDLSQPIPKIKFPGLPMELEIQILAPAAQQAVQPIVMIYLMLEAVLLEQTMLS